MLYTRRVLSRNHYTTVATTTARLSLYPTSYLPQMSQFELKDFIKRGVSTSSTSSGTDDKDKSKIPPTSIATSFVSRFLEVKEEGEKQFTQIFKSFTAPSPSKEPEPPKDLSSTTVRTEKLDHPEQSNVVFEKIRGLTSYIDGGKEIKKITVEEQVVKKGDTKKKAITVTETKNSILGFISEKLSKKEEVKGEMNVVVKLLLGNEYNITLDTLEGGNFDALMEKVRLLSKMDKESADAPPPSSSATLDPIQLSVFLNMVSSIEITSYPPFTCK